MTWMSVQNLFILYTLWCSDRVIFIDESRRGDIYNANMYQNSLLNVNLESKQDKFYCSITPNMFRLFMILLNRPLMIFFDDVFNILARLCSSCVAVCSWAPHVEASIHYHSSAMDHLLLPRPSLGWRANYSTRFSKTQHWGNTGGEMGVPATKAPKLTEAPACLN